MTDIARIVRWIPLMALVSLVGCASPGEPPADFRRTKGNLEAGLKEAAVKLSEDPANVEALHEYASAVFSYARFKQEVSRTLGYYDGYRNQNPENPKTELFSLISALKKASRRDPASLKLLDLLGMACFEACRWEPVGIFEPYRYLRQTGVSALRKVVEADSTRMDARLLLAVLSMVDSASREDGRQAIRDILESQPDYGKAWFCLGESYRNRWSEAEPGVWRYYKEAVRYGLSEPLNYVEMTRTYQSKNLYENAGYGQLIRDIPSPAKAYFLAGANLFLDTDHREIALLEKAVTINPFCLPALLDLMQFYYYRGDFEEALVCFRRADEVDADPEPWPLWGMQSFFERIIQRSPDSYRAYLQWINEQSELIWLGDTSSPQKMADYCERAMVLRPDRPDPHTHLGVLYAYQGMYEKADSQMLIATRLSDDAGTSASKEPYVALGAEYVRQGRHQMAEAAFDKALRSARGSQFSISYLVQYYQMYGDSVKLRSIYREYVESLKSAGGEPGSIAWGFEKAKEVDSSYAWYLRALDADPLHELCGTKRSMESLFWRLGNTVWYERTLLESGSQTERTEGPDDSRNDAYVYLEIGKNYLFEGDVQHAGYAFERAASTGASDGKLLLDVGVQCMKAGLNGLAAESFRLALKRGNERAGRLLKEIEKK